MLTINFCQAHGIDHLVLPTRDYLFAPLLTDICQAVDFIHGKYFLNVYSYYGHIFSVEKLVLIVSSHKFYKAIAFSIHPVRHYVFFWVYENRTFSLFLGI